MLSIAVISIVLLTAGIDYADYFQGAQFIHFLMGPATVALGIPLYEKLALDVLGIAKLKQTVEVGPG